MAARTAEHRLPPPKRFSRQWYLDHAGTVAWTIIITILVWVYADIHFTRDGKIDLKLVVQNGSPREVAVLAPTLPATVPIHVEIRGRQSALDRLDQQPKLFFDAARKFRQKGTYTVNTVDFLQELPEIRQAGKVLSCRPETLTFQTDEVQKLPDRKVRLELPGVEAENVTIKPDRVTLYVPSEQAGQAPEVLIARPDDLGGVQEGKPVTRMVPLVRPTPECLLDPRTVAATFTVAPGQQIREKEFLVPIRIQSPKQWLTDDTWSQYQFQEKPPPQTKARIVISGPAIQLDRLRPEDIDVFLSLTDADKRFVDSWLSGELRVEFHKDKDIDRSSLKIVDPPQQIQYKLIKRTTAATP